MSHLTLRFLLLCLLVPAGTLRAQVFYEVSDGNIKFHSEAPKELISAASDNLAGVLDIAQRTFAFRIGVATFHGFNSALQREHFNENYMETSVFASATYTGKIIEEIDLTKDGEYDVRAKGKITIHGVAQERIIKCHIRRLKEKISVRADFDVPLVDHNIKIPRIVYNKLALVISVSVNASLVPKF